MPNQPGFEHGLPRLVAVVGPTASGKTDLGAALAAYFGGEIVSADAKQVYRGMDLGTAKEKGLPVTQHLLDIKDPGEGITVAEYQALAYVAINGLLDRQMQPFLVGGSGLYAESVLNGYVFGGAGSRERQPRYRTLKLAMAVPRDELKERAYQRLCQRVEQGLTAEVAGLLEAGVPAAWLFSCGLEYRYFSQCVLGEISEAEALERTRVATNQFIKRQHTWWRRHDDLVWVSGFQEALDLCKAFLLNK